MIVAENLKLIKGAFPEQMEIWLITEHVSYLAEFEEVFHRKVRFIKDLNDLILAVEQSPKYKVGDTNQSYMYASVIFYKAMPSEIVSQLSGVLDILNIIEKVNVYEVEREDQVYESSYVYGSLRQLEKDYKGLDRTQYIDELPQEDKQKRVLEDLDTEVNRLRENLNKREENIVKLTKEYKELEKRNNDLKAQIDTEVNVHAKEREKELETTKRDLQEVRDELDLARKNLLSRRQYIKELEDVNYDLEYTRDALENQVTRLKDEVQLKDEDYTYLEEEYRRLQEERADLLLKTSEGEKYEHVLDEIERVRLKLDATEKELRNTRIAFREEEIKNKDLEQTIELLRRGQITQEVMGRTGILDHMTLQNTDLVYIKVVDNLPYHRLAVNTLFEQIDEQYNSKAKLMIISHDDGLDKYRYEGLDVYRSLEDVEVRDKMFRIHPHTSMFTGGREFEEHVDVLFVVDYTGGNDYLIKTEARSNIMTMVRYPEMMKDDRLELIGNPLTMGEDSIYDLTYDPRIADSNLERLRRRVIRHKVEEWRLKLNLRNL